jgi:hypothetical protein
MWIALAIKMFKVSGMIWLLWKMMMIVSGG